MLKKLIRTGLLSHGLLLITPSNQAMINKQQCFVNANNFQMPDSSGIPFNEIFDSLSMPQIQLNAGASKFVTSYIKKNKEDLQEIKKRSNAYFKIIESVFHKNNLPEELKYLAVIESNLKTTAISNVGAAGLWQLMSTTAKELGLKINSKYDERKQVYKSTVAAAKYLKALHAEFDDWLLVVAAYNSGAGTVYNAIRKSGSRNFWKLQYFLPMETRLHVKRFIGTHYYFENKGSIATITKEETMAYRKSITDFETKLSQQKEKDELIAEW